MGGRTISRVFQPMLQTDQPGSIQTMPAYGMKYLQDKAHDSRSNAAVLLSVSRIFRSDQPLRSVDRIRHASIYPAGLGQSQSHSARPRGLAIYHSSFKGS